MKVVINKCIGGYSLSEEAYKFLGLEWTGYGIAFMEDRSNPARVHRLATVLCNGGLEPGN